jgi:8-oxo-dGTP pyrophosphatase MutT (NUDIX family)
MAQYAYGDRIGRTALLKLGASALILNDTGDHILLTRRIDNGRWCLPGGAMDPGESIEECCIREVWEETGLVVRVVRLLGIYSTPHRVTYYKDGQHWQVVAANFLAEITGGTLGVSNETTDVHFFSPADLATLDIVDSHLERIQDFFVGQEAAFVR